MKEPTKEIINLYLRFTPYMRKYLKKIVPAISYVGGVLESGGSNKILINDNNDWVKSRDLYNTKNWLISSSFLKSIVGYDKNNILWIPMDYNSVLSLCYNLLCECGIDLNEIKINEDGIEFKYLNGFEIKGNDLLLVSLKCFEKCYNEKYEIMRPSITEVDGESEPTWDYELDMFTIRIKDMSTAICFISERFTEYMCELPLIEGIEDKFNFKFIEGLALVTIDKDILNLFSIG